MGPSPPSAAPPPSSSCPPLWSGRNPLSLPAAAEHAFFQRYQRASHEADHAALRTVIGRTSGWRCELPTMQPASQPTFAGICGQSLPHPNETSPDSGVLCVTMAEPQSARLRGGGGEGGGEGGGGHAGTVCCSSAESISIINSKLQHKTVSRQQTPNNQGRTGHLDLRRPPLAAVAARQQVSLASTDPAAWSGAGRGRGAVAWCRVGRALAGSGGKPLPLARVRDAQGGETALTIKLRRQHGAGPLQPACQATRTCHTSASSCLDPNPACPRRTPVDHSVDRWISELAVEREAIEIRFWLSHLKMRPEP